MTPALRLLLTVLLLLAGITCLIYAIISVEVGADWAPFAICSVLFAIFVAFGVTIIADWLGIDTDEF